MAFVMDFNSFQSLNEDMQKAKQIITQKKIDPNNPDFLKIQEWLKKRPGYIGMFTKFRFEEDRPMHELEQLNNDLIQLKDLLPQLDKPVVQMQSFDEVVDALRDLKRYQKAKAFFNALLPEQKKWYREANDAVKNQLDGLAVEFTKLPKETQLSFTKKLARYKTLEQLIDSLEGFVVQDWDYNLSKDAILHTPGAELVYSDDTNEMLVARIFTYQASKELGKDTAWCIKDYKSSWDDYVDGDSVFNSQYFIWDFSERFSSNMSRVGVTIKPNGDAYACHAKDDDPLVFEPYLKTLVAMGRPIPADVFAPMDLAQIEKKKSHLAIKKEFKEMKYNWDIKKVFKLLEKGLDPYVDGGYIMEKVLHNKDKKSFDVLIEKYGYKIDGVIDLGGDFYVGYVDFVASMGRHINESGGLDNRQLKKALDGLKDLMNFLVERGCPAYTKYKLPLSLAIYFNDLDYYKELLKKGYRPSDKTIELDDISKYKKNIEEHFKTQLLLAVEDNATDIFMYIANELPEAINNMSDEEKDEIAKNTAFERRYGLKGTPDDKKVEYIKFYMEKFKFDLQTVRAFMMDVLKMRNEELLETFLSVEGALDVNLTYGSKVETPLSYTIGLALDKKKNRFYRNRKELDAEELAQRVAYGEVADKLFDLGAKPNYDDEDDMLQELEFFYEEDTKERFEEYLKRHGDINVKDSELLDMVCRNDEVEDVNYLIKLGAEPTTEVFQHSFPEDSSYRNDTEEKKLERVKEKDRCNKILLALLEAGVNPSAPKSNYSTDKDKDYYIISYANENNLDEIFDFFYKRDNNLYGVCKPALNDWVEYTIKNRKFDQLKKLVEKEKLDLPSLGVEPVFNAVKFQYTKERNSEENKDVYTKLYDNKKLVEYLHKHGAIVGSDGYNSYQPINVASERNDIEMVQLLHKLGADMSGMSFFNMFWEGNAEMFELALKSGVKDFGYSDLDSACERGNVDMLKLAIKYKAKELINKEKLNDYLLHAGKGGQIEVIKYLETLGIDLNYYNAGNSHESVKESALFQAIKHGNFETVKYLISKGAYYKDRKVVYESRSFMGNKEKQEKVVSAFIEALKKDSYENNDKGKGRMEIVKYFVNDLKFKITFEHLLWATHTGSLLSFVLNNGPKNLTDEEIDELAKSAAVNGRSEKSLKVIFDKYKDSIRYVDDIGVKAAQVRWGSSNKEAEYLKTKYLVEEQGADPEYIYDELKTGKNLADETREYLKGAVKKVREERKRLDREEAKRLKDEQKKKGA